VEKEFSILAPVVEASAFDDLLLKATGSSSARACAPIWESPHPLAHQIYPDLVETQTELASILISALLSSPSAA